MPPLVPVSDTCLGECNQSSPCTFSDTPVNPVSNKPNNKKEHNPTHAPQDGLLNLSTQDGLLNLSKHDLSAAEISLLQKGLPFVPTQLKRVPSNCEKALTKLCQNYKNRFSLPKRSERLIDCSFEAMKYDLSNVEVL